jgi:hypothetical protein
MFTMAHNPHLLDLYIKEVDLNLDLGSVVD